MNAIYFQKQSRESLDNLAIKLSKKYSNIVVFQALACEDGVCGLNKLSKEHNIKTEYLYDSATGVKEYLKNENTFYKNIIIKVNELKAKYDFVLVASFGVFGGLDTFWINLKLSKELNLNYVIDNDLTKFEFAKIHHKYASLYNENTSLDELLNLKKPDYISPMAFEVMLESKAKENVKTIVLPEGNDERILKAASILLEGKAVKLIILGNNKEIAQKASDLGIDLDDVKTYNPGNSSLDDECANALYEARKSKGMSLEQAKELIKDRNYFGTLLVHLGYADAMVSGAACSTADTIRPALQIVKTKPGVKSVSGGFFMCLSDKVWYFADCAVNPNPTPENLAEIASVSAATYKAFGFEPRVAMLSYSTANSGSGVSVDLVKQACELAKSYEGLNYDGPIQFDAAVDIATASKKMPDSKVAGKANVFVFPDLNAGNIAYKAVQRSAGAIAVGPVLQGLNKPINDLSRGCLVEDIVNTCLISAIQAQ
ncbi:phosphate acetyltransferase [Campylobacter sp. RM12651]|uniref:phosphate acetyltransferase n=1 Tax=Campylobacter sp. RM12651 TaxID=1660079 RepID=UPI001EFA45E6|nr:phosphate acetyltransferase [Campylobacter sp. RM12651]ULO03571.1 phosphate acetyltransferase [Campylobacter sp. RM12651]